MTGDQNREIIFAVLRPLVNPAYFECVCYSSLHIKEHSPEVTPSKPVMPASAE